MRLATMERAVDDMLDAGAPEADVAVAVRGVDEWCRIRTRVATRLDRLTRDARARYAVVQPELLVDRWADEITDALTEE